MTQDLSTFFLLKFTELSMDQGTQMILLFWTESKDSLFWDFGLINKLLLLAYSWIITIVAKNPVVNHSKLAEYGLEYDYFSPFFFFYYNPTKKLTVIIHPFQTVKEYKTF